MPPFRYENPRQLFVKVPLQPIYGQKEPDVRIGKTLVAAGPRALRVKHYQMIKDFLKVSYGKRHQNIINFFPTRALCRRTPETKLGCGKGDISDYQARIPAGQVLVHIPNIVSANNFNVQHNTKALSHLAGVLPNRCIVRSQYNHFEENSLKKMQEKRQQTEDRRLFAQLKDSLLQPRYCKSSHST